MNNELNFDLAIPYEVELSGYEWLLVTACIKVCLKTMDRSGNKYKTLATVRNNLLAQIEAGGVQCEM